MAVRQTSTLTWSRTLMSALLATLTARPAAALLVTPVVGLFVGDTDPSPDSIVADFTEPTFHGYAAQSIAPVGPVNLSVDILGMIDGVTFIATTGGAISDLVSGYFISDGATALYGAERFAEDVPFGAIGDFLALDAAFPAALIQPVA